MTVSDKLRECETVIEAERESLGAILVRIPNAEIVRRRRARAREKGLCAVCCRATPPPGRTICVKCGKAAMLRNARLRAQQRGGRRRVANARRLELAGDVARQHHSYIEASKKFERALLLTQTVDD